MKDDLRYTPSDCFETFPFPTAWDDLRRPGDRRRDLLRVPLGIDDQERRRVDEDILPLP